LAIQHTDSSPFVGPRPFTAEDRGSFFGRDEEISRLVSLVIAHPVVVLYAVSGAGKTSLLTAGLLPALSEQGFETFPPIRLRSPEPPPAEAPNAYAWAVVHGLREQQDDDDRALSIAAALAERPHEPDPYGFPRPRVLIFDQFEELFTLFPDRWRDREAFFSQVARALSNDPQLRVVFALREEYIAQLERFGPVLPGGLRARFHLERLRHDAALLAITRPLADAGREFASGVAETLIHDLQESRVDLGDGRTTTVEGEFVEPVHLQVVCRTLWENLPAETGVITENDLAASGNVDDTLIRYYEGAVSSAAERGHVAEDRLRDALERSFITSAGTRATVFAGGATKGLPEAAIAVLEDRHVLRGEWRSGARWIELSHDRLIEPLQTSNARIRRVGARRRRIQLAVLGALVVALAVGSVLAGWWSKPEAAPPPPPTPEELLQAYPGDGASPPEKARWMGRATHAHGLPPELPVMAALVESGLRNRPLPGGTHGFFGLRKDIWNRGEYRGFPERPPLQLKWFINQAIAVRDQGLERGVDYSASPARYGTWVADIERPVASDRPKYQRSLDLARTLLEG